MSDKSKMTSADASRIQSSQPKSGNDPAIAARAQSAGARNSNAGGSSGGNAGSGGGGAGGKGTGTSSGGSGKSLGSGKKKSREPREAKLVELSI